MRVCILVQDVVIAVSSEAQAEVFAKIVVLTRAAMSQVGSSTWFCASPSWRRSSLQARVAQGEFEFIAIPVWFMTPLTGSSHPGPGRVDMSL